MLDLPTGTVTFLFTDIEGSTRLLDELGDDYAGLLAEHNSVMRSAVAAHDGIVLDTGGDSFFVVFERASDAVSAAVEAQDGLNEVGVRVRMGIHSGEPSVSNDEYVGMDVHRAARVMAAGHGGQVLLTQPTVDMLEGAFELRDLGEHRLKDLTVPLRLYQLGTGQFPPLRAWTGATADRPVPAGRAQARAEGPCAPARAGPGSRRHDHGARRRRQDAPRDPAAQELVESYNDGVTFVDLAPIRDPEVVLPTIADALAIEGDLASQIGTGQHLLVLDNVEQVVDAAPDIAGLLVAGPGVAVLATSREPCGSPASTSFGSARSPKHPPSSCSGSARRLRGTTSRPTIDSSPESANGSTTCRSRSSSRRGADEVLSPDVLLERLDRRLSVLAAANRGVPARQQTLRATIQWSYGLLTTEERRLFDRLAVFRGGWTVDAAEAVCDADLDTLTSLVDKNLVREDGERFRMLGDGSGYARERLELRVNSADLRRRHAEFCPYLGKRQPHLRGPGREWLDRVEAEHDNFGAALDCSPEADVELGFRITESLLSFWHLRAHEAEARRWVERALETSDSLSPTARATGLHVLGALLFWEETSNVLPVRSRRAWGSPVRPATNAGSRRSPHPRQLDLGPGRPKARPEVARGGDQDLLGARGSARRRADAALHRGGVPGHRRSGGGASSVRGEPRRDA